MDKILKVKNLKISFRTSSGTLKAVRDISFDLANPVPVSPLPPRRFWAFWPVTPLSKAARLFMTARTC